MPVQVISLPQYINKSLAVMSGLLEILLSMDNYFFRKQNREYCEYLLKVLYHESSKVEDWETTLREEKDSELYQIETGSKPESEERLNHMLTLQDILNNGENHISLVKYKTAVQKTIGLTNSLPVIPENA